VFNTVEISNNFVFQDDLVDYSPGGKDGKVGTFPMGLHIVFVI